MLPAFCSGLPVVQSLVQKSSDFSGPLGLHRNHLLYFGCGLVLSGLKAQEFSRSLGTGGMVKETPSSPVFSTEQALSDPKILAKPLNQSK